MRRNAVPLPLLLLICAGTLGANRTAVVLDTILGDYDQDTRPLGLTSDPVEVEVTYRLNAVRDIDGRGNSFVVNLFNRLRWNDPRLVYPATMRDGKELRAAADAIWVPDLFFYNSFKTETVGDDLVTIDPNGDVLYARHMQLSLTADFDLRAFPFDTQTFPIVQMSYSFSSENMSLRFSDIAVTGDPAESLSSNTWVFVDYDTDVSTVQIRPVEADFTDQAVLRFRMSRLSASYIIKYIGPMAFVVMLSIVSYFIDAGAVPARVAFSITLVLTTLTFNANVSSELPRINYPTLLDLYLIMCFGFVLAAVLEYAVVNGIRHTMGCTDAPAFFERYFRLTGFPLLAVCLVLFFINRTEAWVVLSLVLAAWFAGLVVVVRRLYVKVWPRATPEKRPPAPSSSSPPAGSPLGASRRPTVP